ncbi:hypothetical protein VKT23_019701 [Stygiomarasmius scandens]|uniref:Uncharacterized protein n=1 Tax=Marasmiellus scandens TaxID=2682957 RepID=A0ABR1IKQ2_9AGAR
MSLADVLIMLDAAEIIFSGGWHKVIQSYCFGPGMARFGGETNNNQTANFNVTFQGTDIRFIGETDGTSTFQVVVDNNAPFAAAVPNFGAQSNYTQWYQLPSLEDGVHKVGLSELQGGLDYVIITAGPTTPLNENTNILVDEDNTSEILYSGNWDRNTETIKINHGHPHATPLGNTTHLTNNVGDSFLFQFAGTSVSVYGVFLSTATGSVDVEFRLDDQAFPKHISVDSGTPSAYDEAPNHLFFKQDALKPGNHTLSANVTNSQGSQKLIIDYILYTPSFSSLASKPNFSLPEPLSSPSGAGSEPITEDGSPDLGNSRPSIPKGAVVGGVIGGIALILLGVIFIRYRCVKNRSKDANVPVPYPIALYSGSPPLNSTPVSLGHSRKERGNSSGTSRASTGGLNRTQNEVNQINASTQLQIDSLRQRIEELTTRQVAESVPDLPPAYS